MPRSLKELPPLPIDASRSETVTRQLKPTAQQGRVADLVARGLGDKAIMAELGVAKSTVRTQMNQLFLKASIEDRVGLVIRLLSPAAATVEQGGTRHD